MSSLNINDLYETMYEKNNKRLENFDNILKQIHQRIVSQAKLEQTHCFFQVPEFIFGVPLYNIHDLRKYLINSLEKNGFKLIYVEPNWLFITWEIKKQEKYNPKKECPPKNKKNYKLTDEYKPAGNFVYNENDLSTMKNKLRNIL
jgi:hypothetical protein